MNDLLDHSYVKATGKGKGKKCHSKQTMRRELEKKAESFPSRYMDCNQCDAIFLRKTRSNIVKTKCPDCGSKDISSCDS